MKKMLGVYLGIGLFLDAFAHYAVKHNDGTWADGEGGESDFIKDDLAIIFTWPLKIKVVR